MGIPALVAMWNARTSLQRGPASWVRLRDWLVTAQVAATVTLLVASALFATSLARLRAVDPGLDATRVLTLQLAVDRARHGGDEGVAAYLGQVADAVRALPGVEAVGLINRLPLGGQVQAGDIRVEGQDAAIATSWRSIDAGYTTALRVPLVAGRGFDARDTAQAPPVGLVDERLAAMLGGPRAMLGKRFRIDVTASDISWVEVVGVVGHVRDEGLEREGRPLVYWPLAQRTQDRMAMVVRTAADPATLARRGASGDPQRGRRSDDRRPPSDDRRRRAQPRDVSGHRAVHRALRQSGAGARGDRALRGHGLAQPAAATGVRRPAGARRDPPRAGRESSSGRGSREPRWASPVAWPWLRCWPAASGPCCSASRPSTSSRTPAWPG